ncbi:hypothetical protein [Lysobacter sp. F6437]|uniref:hypothetical protein n=1 Tax=Lysobacter sp. F6437 TaxID=3459296 RepID=UPI00403DCCA3
MKSLDFVQSIFSNQRVSTGVVGLANILVRSVLLLTVGLVLFLAMFGAADAVNAPWSMGGIPVRGTAVLVVLAVLLATMHLATRTHPIRPAWFLITTVSMGLLLHVGYGLPLDLEYASDFGGYWRSAATLAGQDNLDVLDNVHMQRAIPFLWPLVEVFGQSRLALICMNAVMLGIVQIAGYDLLRRAVSHQAAQAFSILWIFAPEPLLASAIPSHDVTGTAMFAVALWLNARVFLGHDGVAPGSRWTIFSGIALGVVLYLLDMARGAGTGLLMLASGVGILLIQLLNGWKTHRAGQRDNRPLMLALQLLCGAAVFSILLAIAGAAGLRMDGDLQQTRTLRASVPHQTALSDGSYQFVMRFHNAFNTDLMDEPRQFSDQARAITRSEFLERPVARLWSSLHRGDRLSNLGTQQFFYLATRADQPPWLVKFASAYNSHYVLMMALLALYGLAQLLRAPLRAPGLLQQSALLAAMILALITMRENQPRYIFPIWMVAASLAGSGLSLPGFSSRQLPGSALRGLGHVALAITLTCGLAFAAWTVLRVGYAADDGRVLTRWALDGSDGVGHSDRLEGEQSAPSDVLNTNVDGSPRTGRTPYMVDFEELSLKLAFFDTTARGEHVDASKQVCTNDVAPLSLTFQYYTPYKRLEREGDFTLSVLADGREIWSAKLPQATRPVRATTPPVLETRGTCVNLGFRLRSNRVLSRDSWIRASKVEIFYPHLVPAPEPDNP